jgi:hypothetical protein
VKALRVLLVLLGVGAIAVAIAYPFRQVETIDGKDCGTAWSQAKAELTKNNKSFGGSVGIDVATACKEPKKTVLKRSAALGGAGVILLVVVAAWPERKWRSPDVVSVGGGG